MNYLTITTVFACFVFSASASEKKLTPGVYQCLAELVCNPVHGAALQDRAPLEAGRKNKVPLAPELTCAKGKFPPWTLMGTDGKPVDCEGSEADQLFCAAKAEEIASRILLSGHAGLKEAERSARSIIDRQPVKLGPFDFFANGLAACARFGGTAVRESLSKAYQDAPALKRFVVSMSHRNESGREDGPHAETVRTDVPPAPRVEPSHAGLVPGELSGIAPLELVPPVRSPVTPK